MEFDRLNTENINDLLKTGCESTKATRRTWIHVSSASILIYLHWHKTNI